jgi:hypothetical protein
MGRGWRTLSLYNILYIMHIRTTIHRTRHWQYSTSVVYHTRYTLCIWEVRFVFKNVDADMYIFIILNRIQRFNRIYYEIRMYYIINYINVTFCVYEHTHTRFSDCGGIIILCTKTIIVKCLFYSYSVVDSSVLIWRFVSRKNNRKQRIKPILHDGLLSIRSKQICDVLVVYEVRDRDEIKSLFCFNGNCFL